MTKPVRVHGFRHTFAMASIRNGCSVNVLRRLLGHASLATTQRYIDHLFLSEIRAGVPASLLTTRQEASGDGG